MPPIRSKRLRIGFAFCGVLLVGILPDPAHAQRDYPEEGTVISAIVDHGHVYTIETDDKVFQVLCVSLNPFRQTPPVCNAGGRPIAVKDKVRFRREGDMAYLPETGSGEERLIILSTELKILPPLPDMAAMAPESAAVLGLGLQGRTSRQRAGTTSSSPSPGANKSASSPSTSTGPALAVPVTGGPPVLVIPTGPVNGNVVTGVPTTGGPAITAIPVAHTGGTSGDANASMASAPAAPGLQWVHFVRVETAAHVYDLACASKSCSLEHNPIQLADLLTLRVVKKSAYLSRAGSTANGEQKFEILDVRSVNDPAGVPPHSVVPVSDTPGYPVHPKHAE